MHAALNRCNQAKIKSHNPAHHPKKVKRVLISMQNTSAFSPKEKNHRQQCT
jgi:hypothetical protein